MCSHRDSSVPEKSVFPNGISASGLESFPYEHFSPVTDLKAGWILVALMASPCTACHITHIIRAPFNCSDTWLYSFKICRSYIGAKVRPYVSIRHVCFGSRIWSQTSSPSGSLAFSHLGNQAEISHMNRRQAVSRPARSTGRMLRGPKWQQRRFVKTKPIDCWCPNSHRPPHLIQFYYWPSSISPINRATLTPNPGPAFEPMAASPTEVASFGTANLWNGSVRSFLTQLPVLFMLSSIWYIVRWNKRVGMLMFISVL